MTRTLSFLIVLLSAGLPAKGERPERNGDPSPAATFPEFSWDRVPLYMHIRKAKAYTPEEIAFIAKFPLITFEKANGFADAGNTEEGTLVAARAVKKINPDARILYYRNVIVHYGNYAANAALDSIPEPFLKSRTGETRLIRKRVQAYDLSSPAVRRWWVDAARRVVADPAIDGVFLDGNVKVLEPDFLRRELGAEKKARVAAGYHQMLGDLRKAVGPEKLLIANLIRARFPRAGLEYLDPFDGSYLENVFHNVGGASYEDYLAKGIDAARQAGERGKVIAFTASLNGDSDGTGIDEVPTAAGSGSAAREALRYRLAIFLICASEHSYFRAHEGYSADEDRNWMCWFPEYDRPLGPPRGPATRDGYTYRREFEHASVFVDVAAKKAKIDWN